MIRINQYIKTASHMRVKVNTPAFLTMKVLGGGLGSS
jgi:hypothetical protein